MSDDEPRASEVLARLADQALIDGIDRRAHQRLVHAFDVASPPEPKLHLEPRDWGTGFVSSERREREDLPPEMLADLRELTPQAKLRDLYRPVMESRWHERETRVEPVDASRWLDEARAAQRREPLPRVTPLVREVVAEQRRRRTLVDERWQPAKRDDEPRTAIKFYPDDED